MKKKRYVKWQIVSELGKETKWVKLYRAKRSAQFYA